MTIRILHTSDWHLGHSLHGVPRGYEHASFLSWLLGVLVDENIDAILISGDVFDAANPSPDALRAWYRFLRDARKRKPNLDVIAIAGNHDSAARLEAPRALLEELNIDVVGGVARNADGGLDHSRLVLPLRDSDGSVAAWCLAVPFLRPGDLGRTTEAFDSFVESVRCLYAELVDVALSREKEPKAIVAMGHCYMRSATFSELSERSLFRGSEQALPADIFGENVSYVALGHLHLGQVVAGDSRIRYPGSPIPLSMDEKDYCHHVCVVTLDGRDLVGVKELRIPRSVQMLRIPEDGALPWSDVRQLLIRLDDEYSGGLGVVDDQPRSFLEVRLRLSGPDAGIRRAVAEAIRGKRVRLVKLSVEYSGDGVGLAEQVPQKQLQDLTVDDVFLRRYESVYGNVAVAADLLACFRELVAEVQDGGEQ